MTTRKTHNQNHACAVCREVFGAHSLVAGAMLREPIAQLVRQDCPAWSATDYICRADLARYRTRYVRSLLESEKGELTALEQAVLQSLAEQQLLATNIDAQFESEWNIGERWADRIAVFGGSWTFLGVFGVFMLIWIALNSAVLFWRPIDPYPFILLNLLLSCVAAMQAPIIMMSQNRQEAKDRERSLHDYQINLKAELEIRHLHEKMDHLISHQWERLVQIQEVQLDLLSELNRIK